MENRITECYIISSAPSVKKLPEHIRGILHTKGSVEVKTILSDIWKSLNEESTLAGYFSPGKFEGRNVSQSIKGQL